MQQQKPSIKPNSVQTVHHLQCCIGEQCIISIISQGPAVDLTNLVWVVRLWECSRESLGDALCAASAVKVSCRQLPKREAIEQQPNATTVARQTQQREGQVLQSRVCWRAVEKGLAGVCIRARGVGRVRQAATHAGLLACKLLVGLIGELEGLGICGIAHILCTVKCQQSFYFFTDFYFVVIGSLYMAYPNGCRHNTAFLISE